MISRPESTIPMTRQINVLAYNAVSGAAHRYRNGCPRRIPRIRDRVVLPSLALLAESGAIKPTDNVDFAVVIRRARKIAAIGIGHGSARAPRAGGNVVDLSGRHDSETRVNAAEYINRVGVRGVNRRGIIEGSGNVRQGSPGVSNRIIAVKGICRTPDKAARTIGEGAVTGHGN